MRQGKICSNSLLTDLSILTQTMMARHADSEDSECDWCALSHDGDDPSSLKADINASDCSRYLLSLVSVLISVALIVMT